MVETYTGGRLMHYPYLKCKCGEDVRLNKREHHLQTCKGTEMKEAEINMASSNRTIKFRAWDDKEKKWLLGYEYPNLGGFSIFGECVLFNEWSAIVGSRIGEIDTIKIMQYTGLKDSKGKEIYEADVVLIPDTVGGGFHDPAPPEPNHHLVPIEYERGGFGADVPGYGWMSLNGIGYEFDPVEVIGSIYENPELLEKQ